MSVASNSELTNTIIPKWRMDTLKARYANAVITPKVLNESQLISKFGDRVEIKVSPKLSVGTVTAATGGFTPSASVATNANIIANLWVYVSEEITDQAKVQSFWTAENEFPKMAGAAHAVGYDQALLNLIPSLTGLTAVGNDTDDLSTFSEDKARTACLYMADANIITPENQGELFWALPNVAFYMGWLADTNLTNANTMGVPKNVLTTGYKSQVMGYPAYVSSAFSKTGNNAAYVAGLLHKEALGIVIQKNNEYKLADRLSALLLSHVSVAHSLYGVNTVRTNHGVRVYVKAS